MIQLNVTIEASDATDGMNLGILAHIEKIVELSENSELNNEFFEKAKPHIDLLKKRLQLNDMQVVLLSHFIDKSEDHSIYISEISKTIGCRTIKLLQYMSDIDVLEKRRLIRCSRRNGEQTYFRVPREVLDSFIEDKEYIPANKKNISLADFFLELEKLFDERKENELTYMGLIDEIDSLFEDNSQLTFVEKTEAYNLGCMDKLLLLRFCLLFVRDKDDNIGLYDFEDFFERYAGSRLYNSLQKQYNALFDYKLIENAYNDGFIDVESFKLTDFAKKELLSEMNIDWRKPLNKKYFILQDSIADKKLFYNENERKQIEQLSNLLKQENFDDIRNRLAENGMRQGFACLFYGTPGTGKTETVYQLARQTGRDIFPIDVSRIKSMWVGESEKNIKESFESYREHVRQSEIAPILLFNEADAVLGIRNEGASRAVDKMENSIQNIILQEMENLDGILIATTNLIQNLDKAFERRFIYKIEFGKPSLEAKQAIWKTMLPELKDEELTTLSETYDFSGGQIENITRKYTVHNILTGENPTFGELCGLCDAEKINLKTRKKIGF